MKVSLYTIVIYLFSLTTNFAQDFHFAQFDANPLYLNPALTGERLTEYKGLQFNANYREQFANYTRSSGSYRSIAAGFDSQVNSKFSIGESIVNNRSANGNFNTFNCTVSGAYKVIDQNADDKDNHNLSFGIQMGFLNKSIHPENFTYDAQYSPGESDGFDTRLPSGESFAKESYFKFDLNFGLYYRTSFKNKRLSIFGGASIYHLTQPNESFLGSNSSTPLRFNLHTGCSYKINETVSIMPLIMYMNQAKANELNVGALLFYKIKETIYEPIFGLSARNKNAIIFQLGLRAKGNTFRVSYCLVTHYLKEYRNSGLEFSLVKTLNKKKAIENNNSSFF